MPTHNDLPEPPRGEFDENGRHVHPYVRNEETDPSAVGYRMTNGFEVTPEHRDRESKLMFHAIEELYGSLTPLGLVTLMAQMSQTLDVDYKAELMEDPSLAGIINPGQDPLLVMDPRGEVTPFWDLHADKIREVRRLLLEMAQTCPGCGKYHGGEGHTHDGEQVDRLQSGPYVNSLSGESLKVVRVTDRKVYAVAQVSESQTVERIYDRPDFERICVPADQVAIVEGTAPDAPPEKVGRNEPCPCGSGQKFKRCCGG